MKIRVKGEDGIKLSTICRSLKLEVSDGESYLTSSIMDESKNLIPKESDFLLYTSPKGNVKIEVFVQDETVWLTQKKMAELFDKAKATINEYIQSVYGQKELILEHTMRKFGNSEFSTKPTNYSNLDVIISVGYRVNWLL